MLRMFRPYNFSWIAGCFSVTMAPRYEMCVGMEKGHKTTKNVQKVEFFNFVKCVQPVLRIHLILMRIRILNPHWKKMDPDPGYFFWWTIQKWGHFYNLFFQKFRVEFSSKDLSAVFGDILPLGSGSRKPKSYGAHGSGFRILSVELWYFLLFQLQRAPFFCTTEYWWQKSSRIQRYFFVQIQLVFITSIQKPKFRSREVLQKM